MCTYGCDYDCIMCFMVVSMWAQSIKFIYANKNTILLLVFIKIFLYRLQYSDF